MKIRIKIGILAVLVIGMVLMSGCVNNAGSSGATSTTTPTPKPKWVGVTAIQQGNNIVFIYQGGLDNSNLTGLQYGIGTADHQWNSPEIGETVTLSGATTGQDHIIVIGTFTDGTTQLLLDKFL